MKFAGLFITAAIAATAKACAEYKNCWCERDNFKYQGRTQDNIAWDKDTQKACDSFNGVADGGYRTGYFGKNFKECHRYRKLVVQCNEGINNCEWSDRFRAAGVTTGWCEGKVSCNDLVTDYIYDEVDIMQHIIVRSFSTLDEASQQYCESKLSLAFSNFLNCSTEWKQENAAKLNRGCQPPPSRPGKKPAEGIPETRVRRSSDDDPRMSENRTLLNGVGDLSSRSSGSVAPFAYESILSAAAF